MCRFARLFIILFICLPLVQCTTFQSTDSVCLKTIVIPDLSRAPLYPVIEHDTRIAILSLDQVSCSRANEEATDSKAANLINLTITIPEARKKTDRIKKVKFPLCVALLDAQENVIDRYDELVEITISDKPLTYKHMITYVAPEGVDIEAKDHQLLVGFNGNVTSASLSKASHPLQKAVRKKAQKRRIKQ